MNNSITTEFFKVQLLEFCSNHWIVGNFVKILQNICYRKRRISCDQNKVTFWIIYCTESPRDTTVCSRGGGDGAKEALSGNGHILVKPGAVLIHSSLLIANPTAQNHCVLWPLLQGLQEYQNMLCLHRK